MNFRIWGSLLGLVIFVSNSFAGVQVYPPKKKHTQVYPPKKNQEPEKNKEDKEEPIDEKLAKYLTPKGLLTSPLQVRNEKKGFGIFFGTIWYVQPDGQWTSTRIFRNKPSLRGKGKLNQEELLNLAKALAENEALTLPSLGRPLVNPHVLTIQFGGNTAYLTFGVDQQVPGKTSPRTIFGRYGGIQNAVKAAIEPYLK